VLKVQLVRLGEQGFKDQLDQQVHRAQEDRKELPG